MTLQEMLEDWRNEMGYFDADHSRPIQNINRAIIKIEDLI